MGMNHLKLGSSSWMPFVPQGVKGLDDDEDDDTRKALHDK